MPRSATKKELHILLVEDNPGDVRLTREALDESKKPYRLTVACDGVVALDFLRRSVNKPKERPDIILLDWNLPRMGGNELLAVVKADEDLKTIPVVVLTTSRARTDVDRAYELQANCFITKPVDVNEFFEIIDAVENFWLGTATLPT